MTPVDGPGALSDFFGDPSNGTWTLFVSDNAGVDTGNLAQWCLSLRSAVDSNVVVAVTPGVERGAAWLAPAHPNPVTGSRADIRFALPSKQEASLALFDVAGRQVRALTEGILASGEHLVRWDGRDESGRAVPAGIYLVRLRSTSFQATRRLVVIR
jgi:hypothetical protein